MAASRCTIVKLFERAQLAIINWDCLLNEVWDTNCLLISNGGGAMYNSTTHILYALDFENDADCDFLYTLNLKQVKSRETS